MANSKIAPFYKRSCHDCILLGLCQRLVTLETTFAGIGIGGTSD